MNNCRLLKMFESQEIKVEDFFVKLRFKERAKKILLFI